MTHFCAGNSYNIDSVFIIPSHCSLSQHVLPSLSLSRRTAQWPCISWPTVSESWGRPSRSVRVLWPWPWRGPTAGRGKPCLPRCQRGGACWSMQAWWPTHRSCSRRPINLALYRLPESLTAGKTHSQLNPTFKRNELVRYGYLTSVCLSLSRLGKAIENLQCFTLSADPTFRHFHLDTSKEVKLIHSLDFIYGGHLCSSDMNCVKVYWNDCKWLNLPLLFCLLHSPTGSSHRHSEDTCVRSAVFVLAPPSGLGPGLALLCRIPAASGGSSSDVGRHQIPQRCDIVAASGRSERDQRCGWSAADGQCVCAQGERLQQGRVWRVQWRSLPPHSTSTW